VFLNIALLIFVLVKLNVIYSDQGL